MHRSPARSPLVARVGIGLAVLTAGALAASALSVGAAAAASRSTKSSSSSSSSSGSPSLGSSSSGSSSSTRGKALANFQKCLAQHGVKLPTPTSHRNFSGSFPPSSGSFPSPGGNAGFGGGGDRGRAFFANPNSKQAKAFEACRSQLPAGRFFGGGTFTPTPAQQAALTAFEQCMSAHGVNIASNATFQTIRQLMQADPTAAMACRSALNGAFGHRQLVPGSNPTTSG